MNGVIGVEPDSPDQSEFVEVDPTGRYGRYNEILGKGASKTVYRGFDEYEGIEVAWNQVKLFDFLRSPEDLERLYCEIHLLKTLKHSNIMKFYTSWVDTANRNINFVTEMFTSGTLRQYRLKHKRVNIRAVKHWCRQILRGLLYLHSLDPPVIHRDLKCDNIFINGNQGEVKIGDLGLAAILRKSHADHCVGTPEFMAPEVYAEEYNELVDIYSFGMCILEMVTFEYPYSECSHPAQIYKKVISGKKPNALYKVKDPEVRRFVEKCLATVSHRLTAKELLMDPFLNDIDDYGYDSRPIDYYRVYDEIGPMLRQPHHWEDEIDLFTSQEEEEEEDHWEDFDVSIKGRRREDDGIFLRLRIADKEGRIRNIYFPFDIETDTALSVATEMISELDITDQEVTKIADTIDSEISSLVPDWKCGVNAESNPDHPNLHCPGRGPLPLHGRFEQITFDNDNRDLDLAKSRKALSLDLAGDLENEIRQELRWLKAKYQMQLRKLRDKQIVQFLCKEDQNKADFWSISREEEEEEGGFVKSNLERVKMQEDGNYGGGCSPVHMATAKTFYTKALLPNSLHRTTSLPVDAVDF